MPAKSIVITVTTKIAGMARSYRCRGKSFTHRITAIFTSKRFLYHLWCETFRLEIIRLKIKMALRVI